MIEVTDVDFTYEQGTESIEVLRAISFHVPRGSSCAIIGPSGCGKTTLLYLLAGLLLPTSGRITIDSEPVRPKRRRTALILQDYGLLPWKTVFENVALGLRIRKLPGAEIAERCNQALSDLGIYRYRNLYPGQLSGGQKQRVGIARALVLEPDLLLMDEPFSALDALTREELQNDLLGMWKEKGTTLVLVTHSIEEAVFLGQKILVMSVKPSRILESVDNMNGTPDYRTRPEFYELCTSLRAVLKNGRTRNERES